MDKFEEKETAIKRTFAKSTWYDWCNYLVNYISETMKTYLLKRGTT